MSRPAETDRGFTLIEVVVALAIVSLVLVGALGAASADARATARTVDGLIGAALAEDRLAEALAWLDRDDTPRVMPPPLERFTSRAEFANADDTGTEVVTVVVSWPGGGATYSARRPLTRPAPIRSEEGTDSEGGS